MTTSKKKCPFCQQRNPTGEMYKNGISYYCNKDHYVEHVISKRGGASKLVEKGKEIQQKEYNRETRRRKEAQKGLTWYWKEALYWSNRYNRLSDPYDSCCSCDRTEEEIMRNDGWKLGGCWDAGHFHSRGARKDLAFNEDNVWRQCKSCNAGEGKYGRMSSKSHTVAKRYREKLVERIGVDRVEALDVVPKPKKWTIEELQQIIAKYKAKCKELGK